MRRMRLLGLVRTMALVFMSTLGIADAAVANPLYGVVTATPDGDVDLVSIDVSSGAATTLMTVNIGAGNSIGALAYHASAGKLVAKGVVGGAQSLIVIDPLTGDTSSVAVTGLAGSSPIVVGVAWDAGAERLLVSYSDDGTVIEDRVAEIGLDGVALAATGEFLDDADALGYRASAGAVIGFDANATGPDRVFEIGGLFGAPFAVTIGSPPPRGDVGDIAINEAGVIYANGFDGTGGFLVRLDGDMIWVDLGAYGAADQIRGIAFARLPRPVPLLPGPALLVLALALFGSGAARLRARIRCG